MQCPSCRATNDFIVDSRLNLPPNEIRRRRECGTCHHRFTTYETIRDPTHDPALFAEQHAKAKGIAEQLRDLARSLEMG